MKKETIDYIAILDAMPVGQRIDIPVGKQQTYRNHALSLKRFRQKHFTIQSVNGQYVAIRVA